MASVALPSKEALWTDDIELYGHLQHIHLLLVDDGDRDVILRSIQLIVGRTGQEYNQRGRIQFIMCLARHRRGVICFVS